MLEMFAGVARTMEVLGFYVLLAMVFSVFVGLTYLLSVWLCLVKNRSVIVLWMLIFSTCFVLLVLQWYASSLGWTPYLPIPISALAILAASRQGRGH